MKNIFLLLLLWSTWAVHAQKEASNWFFGNQSGIQFMSDGTVQALPGSQLNTSEGCSTISDADGNLLLYTDGRNVWDRNHLIMPNANYAAGTGLFGDPSSTQSAIIIPKKGSANIYYIFTVDEPHNQNAAAYPNQFPGPYSDPAGTVPADDDGFNNGLNYSIVDLSVTGSNGSIGDVITRNVHLITYNPANAEEVKYKCSEKVTATSNAANTGYWVITHFVDRFYAFEVTAAGVNVTGVVTQLTPIVPVSGYRRNAIGCIKASPNGQKIAIAHSQKSNQAINGGVYLYDFNNATGTLSNPVTIRENLSPYSVEFSPKSQKLYVTYDYLGVFQYNLLSNDIPASGAFLSVVGNNGGTLQLGPDGKIYKSKIFTTGLDVINNPDETGWLCNYQNYGVVFGGPGHSMLGLPPFITSFFSTSITYNRNCLGEPTQFELNSSTPFDSVLWNFDDGSAPSSGQNPNHVYTAIGNYNVVATVMRNGISTQVNTLVTIDAMAIANSASNLSVCDNTTTTAVFDLTQNTNAIRGTQSPVNYMVLYFTSQADADNYTNFITSPYAFTNTSNPQTIYARIQNSQNYGCYATTSFQISVTNTPSLISNTFTLCDDATDGNDTNGLTTFDLNVVSTQLVQNSTQHTTTYYISLNDAQNQSNSLPQSFQNTIANQQIVYARIVNNGNNSCFAIFPVTLIVNPLPAVAANVNLTACDYDIPPDGFAQFNLYDATAQLTGGTAGMNITFFLTATDAATGVNILPGDFTNTTNPQQLFAKVTNAGTGCYRIVPLTLNVLSTSPPAPVTIQQCDDDGIVNGFTLFDLTDAGLESGMVTVTYYINSLDAALQQNAIESNFTNTISNQQTVYARIDNNSGCAVIQQIVLVVLSAPDIDTEVEAIVCENTHEFITLDADVTGNMYDYEWSTGAITSSIMINQPGVYTVNVTNNFGCSTMRTITVSASNVALINEIRIDDLRDDNNNIVTVYVSPSGNVNTSYLYSLDLPDGPFQQSNIFEHVLPGTHTVYVYDINGCGVVSKEISVLSIPKFFTPNGDGVNDTWDIVGMNSEFYKNSQISIFDRYGKILANVDPKGLGWTGTYNGTRLPATDYWYVLVLENGRTVKGHFSIIR